MEGLGVPEITTPQALLYVGAGVALVIIWLATRNRKGMMESEPRRSPDTIAYVQMELKPEDREIFRGISQGLREMATATKESGDKISSELRFSSMTARRHD